MEKLSTQIFTLKNGVDDKVLQNPFDEKTKQLHASTEAVKKQSH